MKLVQILLPVRDTRGRKFKPESYARIRRELGKRCGGADRLYEIAGAWLMEGRARHQTRRHDHLRSDVPPRGSRLVAAISAHPRGPIPSGLDRRAGTGYRRDLGPATAARDRLEFAARPHGRSCP